jgi:hypothetical protein
MNRNELERVIELAEAKVFRNSETLRSIVFSEDYCSPLLEEIVQDMHVDLNLIVSAARQLSPMIRNSNIN